MRNPETNLGIMLEMDGRGALSHGTDAAFAH